MYSRPDLLVGAVRPSAVSLVLALAVAGMALVMIGSGVTDWRAYVTLILVPAGIWSIIYGYVYARSEFYYYGGWGAVMLLGSMAAGLAPIVGSFRAVGLAIILLALIIVVVEVLRR